MDSMLSPHTRTTHHATLSHFQGVWTKDLKMRTNLGQPQINKIIKV
jgi:hypothetical protein